MITGFDRIALEESNGRRELSLEQFLALPLYTRVQLLLENRLAFSLAGQAVRTHDALKELKTLLGEYKK